MPEIQKKGSEIPEILQKLDANGSGDAERPKKMKLPKPDERNEAISNLGDFIENWLQMGQGTPRAQKRRNHLNQMKGMRPF